MKITITRVIILFFLYSQILAQSPLLGVNWTTNWQSDYLNCCTPSSVIFSNFSNSPYYLRANYTYPSGYAKNNIYCQNMTITGNIQDTLILSQDKANYTLWNALFYQVTINYSQVYLTTNIQVFCQVDLIPNGIIIDNQSIYIDEFNNAIFYGDNNSSCCFPNAILITFPQNSVNMTLQYTFGDETQVNENCISNNITAGVYTSQNTTPVAYGINMTTWQDNKFNYTISLNISAPEAIEIGYNGGCYLSLSKSGLRFALKWIASLLIIIYMGL